MDLSPSGRLTRRQFMMRSAQSWVGVVSAHEWAGFPLIGPLGNRGGKSVIFLTMSGGMSHLDTFDPKPDRPEVMGTTRTIATASGGMVGHHLPRTAGVMDRVCVIRSMRTHTDRHAEAVAAMRGKCHPLKIARPDDPTEEFSGGGPDRDRLRRIDLSNQRFHHCKTSGDLPFQNTIDLTEVHRHALDLESEPLAVRKLYGPGRFAAECLSARRLVQSGVPAVEVELGGWDTHIDHFTGMAGRCAEFDTPFAALIRDLENSGMLRDTLVVVATEFGRSPMIQVEHRDGRDHHPAAFSCLLAGGGVRGGISFGETNATGSEVTENPLTFEDLNSLIARILNGRNSASGNVPLSQIFS